MAKGGGDVADAEDVLTGSVLLWSGSEDEQLQFRSKFEESGMLREFRIS